MAWMHSLCSGHATRSLKVGQGHRSRVSDLSMLMDLFHQKAHTFHNSRDFVCRRKCEVTGRAPLSANGLGGIMSKPPHSIMKKHGKESGESSREVHHLRRYEILAWPSPLFLARQANGRSASCFATHDFPHHFGSLAVDGHFWRRLSG
jgi:hypothetical protein